jgi:hypothetical protein
MGWGQKPEATSRMNKDFRFFKIVCLPVIGEKNPREEAGGDITTKMMMGWGVLLEVASSCYRENLALPIIKYLGRHFENERRRQSSTNCKRAFPHNKTPKVVQNCRG